MPIDLSGNGWPDVKHWCFTFSLSLSSDSRQVALFRCACTNCSAATCVFYTRLLSMIIWLGWWSSCCSFRCCCCVFIVIIVVDDYKLSRFNFSKLLLEMWREFLSTNYVTCIISEYIFNLINFNEASPIKTTYIMKITNFLFNNQHQSLIRVSDWLLFACHLLVLLKKQTTEI